MNICVHTSTSRDGESEPRVFFIGGCRKIVANVLERWHDAAHRYFEVSCEDGRRFLLRHDPARNSWQLAGVYAARVREPKRQVPSGAATAALQPRRWWSALRRA